MVPNLHSTSWLRLIGALVAAVAVIVVTGWALIDRGRSEEPPPEATISAGNMPAPTPALLRTIPAASDAAAGLRAKAPALAELFAAVESADVGRILGHIAWQSAACDEFVYRGTTACEIWKVAPGTVVESVRPQGYEVDVQRADVSDAIAYFLENRHPRVQLIARLEDGAYVLSFGIDPQPGLLFPGRIAEGGAPVGTWYLITAPSDPGKIASYGYRSIGGLPLDFIRVDQFRGVHRYEILGVNEEFRAPEQAAHDAQEKANHTP